jgi:hypothetical protein
LAGLNTVGVALGGDEDEGGVDNEAEADAAGDADEPAEEENHEGVLVVYWNAADGGVDAGV